jgi:hypothetical protein
MRARRPLGRGTLRAYETVREHVPVLVEVDGWEADVAGLVDAISDGSLRKRVAISAGGRQELSANEGPGALSDEALSELEEEAETVIGHVELGGLEPGA